jgi:hypothetical protein
VKRGFADAQTASCDQQRKLILRLLEFAEHFEGVFDLKSQSLVPRDLAEFPPLHVPAGIELLATWSQSLALAPVVHARHDALVLTSCRRFDIETDQPCFQLGRVNLDSDFLRPLRHEQMPHDLLAQFSGGLLVEGIVAEIFLSQFPEGEQRGIGLGDQLVERQLADLIETPGQRSFRGGEMWRSYQADVKETLKKEGSI